MTVNWLKAISQWSEIHNENLSNAKFQIGDKVKTVLGKESTITGVNDMGDDIEYSLAGHTYLFYEYELEKI